MDEIENILLRRVPISEGQIPFDRSWIAKSIPERFEYIVKTIPKHFAVIDGGENYSYQELNKLANCLAFEIIKSQKSHIDKRNSVALLLGHNVNTIVGMLGTLKAGGFFTPIDPQIPQERKAFIIKDSKAKILITDNESVPTLDGLVGNLHRVINLDDLPCHRNPNKIDIKISPDFYSNLVYTSGSTGQPKGVIYQHRNLLHAAWRGGDHFSITPRDRISLTFSFSFGGSLLYTFGTLLNGGTLYPFSIKHEGLKRLISWLQTEKITFFQATPTTLRQLTEILTDEDEFPEMRILLTGGETIHVSDLKIFDKYFPNNTFLRLGGGTTESLIIAECFLKNVDQIEGMGVPMGYVVPDKEVQIWDEKNLPVPMGVEGEIVVKSKYLSAGYWNQPGLTKDLFLRDPEESEELIYKTGDIGYLTKAGVLFHLGRKDKQVKIRGHRVELDEIERNLLELEGVTEAIVVGNQDWNGNSRIIAYVVPAGNAKTSISRLRESLAKILPDYMVPSFFIFLEVFPLTVSRKIDYKALPEPSEKRPELDSVYIHPRNEIEEKLAGIWSEVLGVTPIGVLDNFLDLGGHSLHITQISNRIQDELKVSISIRTLLELSTISELGEILG